MVTTKITGLQDINVAVPFREDNVVEAARIFYTECQVKTDD